MTPFKVKMKQKPLKQSADLCQLSQDWRSIQRSIDHVCKRRERYWTHRPTTHATGETWAQADMDTGAVRNLNKSNHRSSSGQAAADKAKKEKPSKSQQSLAANFTSEKRFSRAQIFLFPNPSSSGYCKRRRIPSATEKTPQAKKPQQISHCHSPISEKWFSRPKNHVFLLPPPRSSGDRKKKKSQQTPAVATLQFRTNDFGRPKKVTLFRAVCHAEKGEPPAVSRLQFQKNDFPDPKIIFFLGRPLPPPRSSDTAKEEIPAPAIATLHFCKNDFGGPEIIVFRAVCQAEKGETPAAPPVSSFRKMIFPTPKSFFWPPSFPPPPPKQWHRKRRNPSPSNQSTPISQRVGQKSCFSGQSVWVSAPFSDCCWPFP